MNQRDDLDRTLEAWFGADAPVTAPRHVLDRMVAETGHRSPRPAWLATLRGDGLGTPAVFLGRPARPLLALALLGALLVGLVGGALIGAGGLRLSLSVPPTPTTGPTERAQPDPTLFLSGGDMPTLDVPAGLDPRTTAYSWELHVVALLKEHVRQLGWEAGSPRVLAIHLLAPGSSYATTWVDGLDHGGTGFTADRLTWAVDAEGTLIACGTKCAVAAAGTFFFDDVSEALLAVGTTGPTTAIPATSYRAIVEEVGRAFRPVAVLPSGALDQSVILDSMRAAGRLPAGTRVDPIYGTVICVGSNPPCQGWGLAEAGQSEAIWWIGLPDITLPGDPIIGPGPAWDTYDAQTGEHLLGNLP